MQIRRFKYRIRPNAQQALLLNEMLRDFCHLYNAGLQQRIEAYRRRGVKIGFFQQSSEVKDVRACDIDGIGRWSANALIQVLRRLDQTYSAFFRRGRGFPRFRSSARFCSADFRVGQGLTIKANRRLGVVGVPGGIKVVWHREFPAGAKLGTGILTCRQGKWYVVFSVEAEFTGECGTGTVGIDLGLNSLIATSDGETIATPRHAHKAQKAQRRRQRALARCERGSKRRIKIKAQLAASSARIARQRCDHLHKLSRSLVLRYQGIAFERLNMTGLKKGMLARSIHDAAWSTLVQFTTYKAENAGGTIVMVDPRFTSQTCPSCGIIKPKRLIEREHRCDCGCDLDRDVAAAMIVHQRAFSGRGTAFGR